MKFQILVSCLVIFWSKLFFCFEFVLYNCLVMLFPELFQKKTWLKLMVFAIEMTRFSDIHSKFMA